VDEDLSVLSELRERKTAEVKSQINGLLLGVAPVGEMLEGD